MQTNVAGADPTWSLHSCLNLIKTTVEHLFLTLYLNYLDFHPLEVVSRHRDQLTHIYLILDQTFAILDV